MLEAAVQMLRILSCRPAADPTAMLLPSTAMLQAPHAAGSAACTPVNDASCVQVGKCCECGQNHLTHHPLLCHGTALTQQLLQQITT